MVKQSAQPGMDAGSQAMAMAAQQAKPEGGTPLPKAIKPEEDKSRQEEGKMMETMNKLEEKHRKEVEKKDNELQSLKHQLDMEQLDRKRMVGEHSMEQKQKAQMDQLKQQRDELDRYKAEIDRQAMEREKEFERKSLEAQKNMEQEHTNQQTMQQAEQISHQAELDKQTAEQRVAVAEEKAKAMMEISQQQANDYIKTTERAKQTTDKYFADREAQMKASSPVISTALQNQMDSAFKAVGRLGAVRNKINAIPQPGTPPEIKMASIVFCDEEQGGSVREDLIPASVDTDIVIPMPSAVPVVKSARIVTGLSNEYLNAQEDARKRANDEVVDYGIRNTVGQLSDKAEFKSMQSADQEGRALMDAHMGKDYQAQMRRDVADVAQQKAREQAGKNRKSSNEAERADAFRFQQFNRRVWSSDLLNGNWGGKSESGRDAMINQYRDQVKAREDAEAWGSRSALGKGMHYLGQVAYAPWNAAKWVGKNVVGGTVDDLINGTKGFYDMAKTHWQAGRYNLGYGHAAQANEDAGRTVLGTGAQLLSGVVGAAGTAMTGGALTAAARAGMGAAGRAIARGGVRTGMEAYNAARGAGQGIWNSAYQGARAAAPSARTWGKNAWLSAKNYGGGAGWMNGPRGIAMQVGSQIPSMFGMYGDNANNLAYNTTERYFQDQMPKAASTYLARDSWRGGEQVGEAYGLPIYEVRKEQQQAAPATPEPKPAAAPVKPEQKTLEQEDPHRYEGVTSRHGSINDYQTGYDHRLIGNPNWKHSVYENTRAGQLVKKFNPYLKMLTGMDLMKRNTAVEQGIWKPEVLSPQTRLLAAMDAGSDARLINTPHTSAIGAAMDAHRGMRLGAPYFNRIPASPYGV